VLPPRNAPRWSFTIGINEAKIRAHFEFVTGSCFLAAITTAADFAMRRSVRATLIDGETVEQLLDGSETKGDPRLAQDERNQTLYLTAFRVLFVDLQVASSFRVLIVLAMLATIASTLWVYPHQLAYFNEAAGGPENGYKHLLGSNFDWGQDLLRLREWMRMHAEIRPVYGGFKATYDARYLGVEYSPLAEIRPGKRMSGIIAISSAEVVTPCDNRVLFHRHLTSQSTFASISPTLRLVVAAAQANGESGRAAERTGPAAPGTEAEPSAGGGVLLEGRPQRVVGAAEQAIVGTLGQCVAGGRGGFRDPLAAEVRKDAGQPPEQPAGLLRLPDLDGAAGGAE
jgi:hypothetical protein